MVEVPLTKPCSKALLAARVQVLLKQISGEAGTAASVFGALSPVLEEVTCF